MNKCKKCDVSLTDERVYLGYDTCVGCSETEKYSSHTVYPHKTGGYVQPVDKDTADHLKKLDRRSAGSGKAAKGIMADGSWDRWLEQYLYNKNNPKSKPKKRKTVVINTFIPYENALQDAMSQFNSNGYTSACELTQSLYTHDKINLQHKSRIMNELGSLQMMTSKERKFFNKLAKKA
mgnify:CR=1 FL=1|tara:strand:- start:650 stop:1183 length:534 start_codon:yes stop_codon:yes gene_type:complete